MTQAVYIVAGLAAAWLVLALLIPRLPAHHQGLANRITVILGVPVLGLLTRYLGPAVGLAAFASGVALLCWQPLRRRAPADPGSRATPAE